MDLLVRLLNAFVVAQICTRYPLSLYFLLKMKYCFLLVFLTFVPISIFPCHTRFVYLFSFVLKRKLFGLLDMFSFARSACIFLEIFLKCDVHIKNGCFVLNICTFSNKFFQVLYNFLVFGIVAQTGHDATM